MTRRAWIIVATTIVLAVVVGFGLSFLVGEDKPSYDAQTAPYRGTVTYEQAYSFVVEATSEGRDSEFIANVCEGVADRMHYADPTDERPIQYLAGCIDGLEALE